MSFIYVGRLDELKGIKILFEAWKMMEENAPKLIVCGTGPLEGWCRGYVKKNKLSQINIIGNIANTKVRKLIAESRALILPTLLYEGFPMTLVEAYSVGTPVIGSDIGNVGDLIKDGVTGWKFKYKSKEGLIKIICDLKDGDIPRVDEVYRDRYSAKENYRVLQAIYDSLKRE